MKTFTYCPEGTCSVRMDFSIDEKSDVIEDFRVVGGCPGNLAGIRRLIIGLKAEDVAKKLEGVTCGQKDTFCPDQLSKALKQYLKEGKE